MEEKKHVKYKLKAGESVEAGVVEFEITKYRPEDEPRGLGRQVEVLITAPPDVLIRRVKKRGDGDPVE